MRAVLDSNVVVSALLWGGTSFKLLQAASDGGITLYTSPALLAELREVLAREHLARRLVKQHASIEEAVRLHGDLSIPVTPLTSPAPYPPMPPTSTSSPLLWPPGPRSSLPATVIC